MEAQDRTGPDENSTQNVDEDSQRTFTCPAFPSLASLLLPTMLFLGPTVFENELRALLSNVPDSAVTEITAAILGAELPSMDSLLALAGVSGANVAQSNEELQKQVVDSLNICWNKEGKQRPAIQLGFKKLAMGRCLATTP